MASVAIAWLLGQLGVTSVIVGARNPDQIARNAEAADLALPSGIIDELTEATEEVKQMLGPNPDMWQSESRYR
jgi:aryl-alcohol dehydrogenase-like predicted oxidoreductase